MKPRFVLPILILLGLLLQNASVSVNREFFYLGGIQVNEPDNQAWIQALKQAKMNTVEVTVYATQEQWDSDNLRINQPSDAILQEIRLAKSQGLKVSLILRIALDHTFPENQFLWHGLIMPRTNRQLKRWFQQYSDFVLRWAAIAETEGVDILGIGSEMKSLTATIPVKTLPELEAYYLDQVQQDQRIQAILKHRHKIPTQMLQTAGNDNFDSLESFLQQRRSAWQHWAKQVSFQRAENPLQKINQRRTTLEKYWRQLIQKTRLRYSGKLTLAANFDEYSSIKFWDDLDFIGVNAYFPLRSELKGYRSPSKEFEHKWREILQELWEFRRSQNMPHKPFIFTELGYTRHQYSTIEPWAYGGFSLINEKTAPEIIFWNQQPLNLQERVWAVNALHRVTSQAFPNLLQGILYWKLSTQPTHREVEPFVLILNSHPPDPLQSSLHQFLP